MRLWNVGVDTQRYFDFFDSGVLQLFLDQHLPGQQMGGGRLGIKPEEPGERSDGSIWLSGLLISIAEHVSGFVGGWKLFEPGNGLLRLREHEITLTDEHGRLQVIV